MRGFFVTSSGTEIGKTHVSALMLRQLRAQGREVNALKPILSGYADEGMAESDAGILLSALGRPVDPSSVAEMTPWRFSAALSPDMAAQREDRPIDFQALIDFCKTGLDGKEEVLLIEGAGGVLAPINEDYRMVDIPRVLAIPAVLVVGSYLGTISHTLTAMESLQSRGVAVAGIVISQSVESPVELSETKSTIERFCENVPIMTLPRVDLTQWREAPDLTVLLD